MLVLWRFKKVSYEKGEIQMKLRACISLLIISSPLFATASQPMLVVLIMAKDEHQVIIPTLETYLSANIKAGKPDSKEVAYILYDTGSTDGKMIYVRILKYKAQ